MIPPNAPLPLLYTPAPLAGAAQGVPRVAVIMRTKDRAILLPRALDSVLAQSFTGWHLYLVNDGGDPAALAAVLAPYLPRFAGRLSLLHHAASRGMEAASNAGLAAGEEPFFAIHDDDDAWAPDFLARTVAHLTQPAHAAQIGVAVQCEVVQERLDSGQIVKLAQFPWIYLTPPVEYAALLVRNQVPPIALLLRRAVLARIGTYNEAMPVLGDWEFILRAMAVGDLGCLQEKLAFYHHRVATDSQIYANSVTGGVDLHREMQVRLGNQLLRNAVAAQPGTLGLLWPLLQRLEALSAEATARNAAQLQRLEEMNAGLSARIGGLEAQLQAVRAGTDPFRRLFGLLRRLRRRG